MRGNWQCTRHSDCFALTNSGRCGALSNTDFKGECPFYKTVEEQKNAKGFVHREGRMNYEYVI